MSINRVIVSGRLGKDVDLRQTPNGKELATFSLAVTDSYNRDITHWLNITVWGATAVSCSNYIGKGSHVAVEGRINVKSYENKDGLKVKIYEIVADRVEFLDPKGSRKESSEADDSGWDDLGREIPPF